MRAVNKYPSPVIHNMTVMARRLNTPMVSMEWSAKVWTQLKLRGESYRSALAAVAASYAMHDKEYDLESVVSEGKAFKAACLIGYLVGEGFVDKRMDAGLTPVSGESTGVRYMQTLLKEKLGEREAMASDSIVCSMLAARILLWYVSVREYERSTPAGRHMARMIIANAAIKDRQVIIEDANLDSNEGYM